MRYFAITFTLIASTYSNAEILKQSTVCGETRELCFLWWPKLNPIKGWSQDMPQSVNYKSNAQAPNGYTFANAEAVIYAKAIYKARQPKSKNLAEFISSDKQSFLSRNPSLKITNADPAEDKAGRKYIGFDFTPEKAGNWERVLYSEETDKDKNEYYLVFVLSSRSKAGYEQALSAYKGFVATYE